MFWKTRAMSGLHTERGGPLVQILNRLTRLRAFFKRLWALQEKQEKWLLDTEGVPVEGRHPPLPLFC